MNTLLISYDLIGDEQLPDYQRVFDYIKSFDGWAKPLQSVWLVKTTKSASVVRDELKSKTDSDDRILVINITGSGWATSFISKSVNEWMYKNM